MPTYEFRCPNGHEFERFYRKISDAEAEVPCPECGAPATRQVSGGAGLLFKGSGFYLTDYGRNAHRKGGASAGKNDSSGSESKSDAKPADAKSSESKGGESSGSSSSPASSGESKAPAKKPDGNTGT